MPAALQSPLVASGPSTEPQGGRGAGGGRGRRPDPDKSLPNSRVAGELDDRIALRAREIDYAIRLVTTLAAEIGVKWLPHPRGKIFINPANGRTVCLTDGGRLAAARVDVDGEIRVGEPK